MTLRGGSDLKGIYQKCISDVITSDLQGFTGPVPVVQVATQVADFIIFMPADGAVIRYLARVLRNVPDNLVMVRIGQGNAGYKQAVVTTDGSTVLLGPAMHGISIHIKENYGRGIARFDSLIPVATGLIRAMGIQDITPGFLQVLTTLSRKIRSLDGTWGEEPKFPIVNISNKLGLVDPIPAEDLGRSMHGNNRHLFGDKGVYPVIALGDKLPFIHAEGNAGTYKWTQPKA